jgi:membrane protease YdiL (CAAX protease family)
MISELIQYNLLILPGLLMVASFLVVIPRSLHPFRIMAYIFLFLLMRDAMTPMKFWFLGTEGFFWMRFRDDALLLLIFATFGPLLVLMMNTIDKDLKALLIWFKGDRFKGICVGIAGAGAAVLPLFTVYLFVPIEQRGGEVSADLIAPILLLALLGNFLEEVLFRGYFQGYLEQKVGMSPIRAALASGVGFAFGHIFLAVNVTDAGINLLLFALYEGVLAGLVRMRFGVIPATLTHGLAVFLLTSGLMG